MLDRTKTMEKMVELKASAEKAALEYNEAFAEGKFSEAAGKLNIITDSVNQYTANAKALAFDDILSQDDPLAYACRIFTFKTIACTDQKIDGSIISKKVIGEADRPIDLGALQKYAKGEKIEVGTDKQWLDAIHKLNYLMTVQVAEELGIDPSEIRDCYRIKDVAKEYQFGIAHAADGSTQTLMALEKIMGMMIASEHYDAPSMHEVRYLNRVWGKKGKKCLEFSAANHKQMTGIIMEIAHKLITGECYSIDYKRAKGK